MSQLTCPECGTPVSQGATFCKNCGCKITVCPDCGEVYKAGQARCNECGRVLSEETLGEHIRENAKKIKARIDEDEKREKRYRIIDSVVSLIGFVPIAICFVLLMKWREKSGIELYDTLESTKRTCKALFCTGIVISILGSSMLGLIKDRFGTAKLCDWVKQNQFDYRGYICTYGNAGEEAEQEKIYVNKLSEAALLLENRKEKLALNIIYIFRCVVGVIIIVAGSVWANHFFDRLFALHDDLYAEFQWADEGFYVAVVALAISIVVRITYFFIQQNHIGRKKLEILHSAKK